MILYREGTLRFIINDKTIRKVMSELLTYDIRDDYPERIVTSLTKRLRYKNKSTVSRALKCLRNYGILDKDNRIIQAKII